MPIEITPCDKGLGTLITSCDRVTDEELIDSMTQFLTHGKETIKKNRYILIDHTALNKLDIQDKTVKLISGHIAKISKTYPDPIVAMVTYVAMTADMDLVKKISRLHELFIHRSNWEKRVFRTRSEAVRWIRERVSDKFGIEDLTFD